MPTYEYACNACDHRFEQFQSITAKPVRKCPRCGKLRVQRLISGGAGLLFKGSGFYITDYRSESYKQAAQKDGNGVAGGKTETSTSEPKTSGTKKTETKKPKSETTSTKA